MNNKDIKFVFFGTPDVASETLQLLQVAGYLPSLVVTSVDKPQGRKMILTASPVKTWAIKNNIPYIQPEKITPSTFGTSTLSRGRVDPHDFDFFLVVAYGKILSEEIIKVPRLGSINIHYSLLPKYRGASPVESAILAGEAITGIAIQQMEYKMDSGPILASEEVEILPTETTDELRKRLIEIGGNLLVKILPEFLENKITPVPQDESQATFCKKIKKEDGLVDTENEPAKLLYNKFRAYNKWPRIFYFENGKRIIISDAILENTKFTIKKVIPEGKKEITLEEFQRQTSISK